MFKTLKLKNFLVALSLLDSTTAYAHDDHPPPPMAKVQVPVIKHAANTVIRFSSGALVCRSKSDLEKILTYADKRQMNRTNTMVAGDKKVCDIASQMQPYKIVSAEYKDKHFPQGLLKVVEENSVNKEMGWAIGTGAVAVTVKP